MKNTIKIVCLLSVILLLGSANFSFGQATATAQADAHATIVIPISIVKVSDMEFGNVAVGALSGTINLAAAAATSRTPAGGVSLPAVTGTVSAAAYTVSGQANYIYGITLPTSITIVNGANSMMINSIVSSPSVSGTLSASGTDNLYVGGKLNVNASQAAGIYSTTATYPVTVVYN